MDKINERIEWCVKNSGLNKTEFAKRINVSQSFVSRLILGIRAPSDRTISDICREFDISEVWLRTGKGNQYVEPSGDVKFLRVMEQINMSDDDLIKRIIKAYWDMTDEEKAVIKKLIDEFCGQKENAPD